MVVRAHLGTPISASHLRPANMRITYMSKISPTGGAAIPFVRRATFEMPEAGRGNNAPYVEPYPFSQLAVGETMLFATISSEERKRIRQQASYAFYRIERRCMTRTLTDGPVAVQRIPDDTPKRAQIPHRVTAAPESRLIRDGRVVTESGAASA